MQTPQVSVFFRMAMVLASLLAGADAMAQATTSPIPPPSLTGSTVTMGSSGGGSNPLTSGTSLDASGDYQSELQACNTGRRAQSRDLCIREAQAAQAERRRGTLSYPGSELARNAQARCAVHRDTEDKGACEARVLGYGTASGSVEGGGVLHEVETVVLPPGQSDVRILPKTWAPVVILPMQTQQ